MTEPADAASRPIKIFLVDDEEVIRDLLALVLEHSGFEVVVASHPAEALVLARDRGKDCDLLLTDVRMPGMNGRELADKLLEASPDMKVVFMSGETDDHLLLARVAAGQAAYIQKPFTPDALVKRLKDILQLS